jgi:putative membrane protein
MSGLWEIIESWVARAARPDLGLAVLGSQGDVWDAQKDMTAAFYGSLLAMLIVAAMRKYRASEEAETGGDTAYGLEEFTDEQSPQPS